jgi:hypothetical protein
MQLIPKPPVAGWDPKDIVEGFLTASASSGYRQIALQYLAPSARSWNPGWSATVYSQGPIVNPPLYPVKAAQKKTAKGAAKQAAPDTATVTVGGKVQANLSGTGGYVVPDASARVKGQPTFDLVKDDGQWRIKSAPPERLLTSLLFNLDYQLRNLYFFDQTTDTYLVPDPAYVPLQATQVELTTNLVNDLIKPPGDWVSPNATLSAFPQGTRLIDVTVPGGTAMVNLSIPISKGTNVTKLKEQISAQLLYTLTGSGQAGSVVQSVELSVNGVPWSPPNSQENPVQRKTQAKYWPPAGASSEFYYTDSAGWLVGQDVTHGTLTGTPTRIDHLGKGYSQIAVSPGSPGSPGNQYVAALTSSGALYAGPLDGRLTRQHGAGYLSISWDPEDDLWANTASQVWQLPGPDNPGQPFGQPLPVPVTVQNSDTTANTGPFTALRVAPDGVRMAIIVQSPSNGSVLYFGAINYPQSTRASQQSVLIKLSPFNVSQAASTTFESVSWYGSNNVITLSAPNHALTEYPVNGGSSTAMPSPAHIASITASDTYPLIAGLVKGGLTAATITSVWPLDPIIKNGFTPVYPG